MYSSQRRAAALLTTGALAADDPWQDLAGMDMTSTQSAQKKFPQGAALVVGGSGGLGAAIAKRLGRYGSAVALTYNSRRERGEAVAGEIADAGGRASAYPVDLTQRTSVAGLVENVVRDFGALHTVVFAAGPPFELRYISQTDPATMEHHLASDIMGFFHVTQAALPHLRKSRGSLLACCTCGIDRWPVKDAISVVPKAGVWAIARGVAREEGRFGVRANVIGTGVINAGSSIDGLANGNVPENFIEDAVAATPLRRLGEADDIAEAACFLASQQASFITGQVLNVDGGWSI
jgi:3-oxoacyl-[acyl-carrier protein] reductase